MFSSTSLKCCVHRRQSNSDTGFRPEELKGNVPASPISTKNVKTSRIQFIKSKKNLKKKKLLLDFSNTKNVVMNVSTFISRISGRHFYIFLRCKEASSLLKPD